ncbi:hypothetical protein BgiBS90_020044, partial [Biomphalaria glabrata]
QNEDTDLKEELRLSFLRCKKNPGHKKFIPTDCFTLNHLPETLQNADIYDLIKNISNLTVQVIVRYVSHCRPNFWPRTTRPFPFYQMIGSSCLRAASGFINEIYKCTNRKCPCQSCQHSDTPSTEYWGILLNTATHVVFDEMEARRTSIILYYDSEETPGISLNNITCVHASTETDLCQLKCVTCDKNLGDKLYQDWKKFYFSWDEVHNKYRESRDVEKACFIVSHPHGCSKQISFGKWYEKIMCNNDYNCRFTYRTATCPGTSGAIVCVLGYGSEFWNQIPHAGTTPTSRLNFSGEGEIWSDA